MKVCSKSSDFVLKKTCSLLYLSPLPPVTKLHHAPSPSSFPARAPIMENRTAPYTHSFTIERKTFSIGGKTSFHITEANKDRSYTLSLKLASRPWLSSIFSSLIGAPLTQKFFQEIRLDEYVLFVEKVSSRKGHCAEITKLGINGGLNKIIIPVGNDKWGWKKFLSLLIANNQPTQPTVKTPPSYKTILATPRKELIRPLPDHKAAETRPHQPLKSATTDNRSGSKGELASFSNELTVIVFRSNFHDDWVKIHKAICNMYPFVGSISLVQPDRALISIRSTEYIDSLCSHSDWFLVETFFIRCERWSSEAFHKKPVVPSYGGWIKIRNLPMDEWSFEVFQQIGDECGGYLDTSQKTLSRMDMIEVSIKVKENNFGFIPATLHLSHLPSSSLVTIEPFFKGEFFFGFLTGIHGVRRPKNHLPPHSRASPYPPIPLTDIRYHRDPQTDPPFVLSSSPSPALIVPSTLPLPRGPTIDFTQQTHQFVPTLIPPPITHPFSLPKSCISLSTNQHQLSPTPKPSLNQSTSTFPNPLGPTTDSTQPTQQFVPSPVPPPITHPFSLPKSCKSLSLSTNQHQLSPTPKPSLYQSIPSSSSGPPLSFHFPQKLKNLSIDSALSSSGPPLPLLPSSSLPDPPIQKSSLKPLIINNKPSLFRRCTLNSTSANQRPSDTDDFLSSHCSLTDGESPFYPSSPQPRPPPSPPSLATFFDDPSTTLALVDEPLHLPLDASPISEEHPQPSHLSSPVREANKNFSFNCIDSKLEADPSTCLALLFPWMAKYGMCIMPIPSKQKPSTAKKARNWNRELLKLQSSINYDKLATTSNEDGKGSKNSQ